MEVITALIYKNNIELTLKDKIYFFVKYVIVLLKFYVVPRSLSNRWVNKTNTILSQMARLMCRLSC